MFSQKTRIMAMVLACALLGSVLVSCGGEKPSETASSGSTAVSSETETDDADVLGIAKEDNGGKEFTIFCATEKSTDFLVEAENGDVVNDALYKRNLAVEDYYGIKLTTVIQPGGYDTRSDFNTAIRTDVVSGDSQYDLICAFLVCTMPTVIEGLYTDLNTIKSLNLSNPWWVSDLQENIGVSHKLYAALGDANLNLYRDMYVCYFNKTLIDQYKMQNPYDMVRSGSWTLDNFTEMAKQVSGDLNSDGKYDIENDKFGYVTQGVFANGWQISLGCKVFDKDKDDIPYSLGLSERMTDAWEKVSSFHKEQSSMLYQTAIDYNALNLPLTQDRALFTLNYLSTIENEYLRNMKSDFGIVPYPKFDENQEDYYTMMPSAACILLVPSTAKDQELTAKVMESMGYYTSRDVVPAYFEVALKDKYTRDSDVPEMLEIIRNSAKLDFGVAYSEYFDLSTGNFFRRPDSSIVSSFASSETMWETKIKNMVGAIQDK